MSTQPKALFLADVIDNDPRSKAHHDAAAAELRRLVAENERLAAEVANRNRRALAGDEAVAALANVHAHYECLEAQRDALLEALRPFVTIGSGFDMEDVRKARAAIKMAEEGE